MPPAVDSALVSNLLQTTVVMAVPLLLAAMGELLVERTGMINIGVEGTILVGALTAAIVAYHSGSPWLAVAGACGAGLLFGATFALVAVLLRGNQVVTGTAMNLVAFGSTGVAYRAAFGVTGAALTVPGFAAMPIPGLAEVPVLGESFFRQPVLGYVAFLLAPAAGGFLHRTLPGLRWRMAGENPAAAAAQGVAVRRTRCFAVLLGSVFSALAGAYLVLAYTHTFVEGMSAGRGFIALALVVFSAWSVAGVVAGALLFGFATAVQFHVQAGGWAIPYQFSLMLPYVLTLAVLAVAGPRRLGPAALGQETEGA